MMLRNELQSSSELRFVNISQRQFVEVQQNMHCFKQQRRAFFIVVPPCAVPFRSVLCQCDLTQNRKKFSAQGNEHQRSSIHLSFSSRCACHRKLGLPRGNCNTHRRRLIK
jgi:hypothetical protein